MCGMAREVAVAEGKDVRRFKFEEFYPFVQRYVFSTPADFRIRFARTSLSIALGIEIIISARLAKVGLHARQHLMAHVRAGAEPARAHLRARSKADVVEFVTSRVRLVQPCYAS